MLERGITSRNRSQIYKCLEPAQGTYMDIEYSIVAEAIRSITTDTSKAQQEIHRMAGESNAKKTLDVTRAALELELEHGSKFIGFGLCL